MKHTRKKSNGMKKHMFILPVFLVAVVALILGASASVSWGWGGWGGLVELDDTSIIVEVNETDGDAGFQIFADGEGWRWVGVFDPNWHLVFKARTGAGARDVGGGTEVFSETAEPEYETLEEFQEILDNLQPGIYKFYGRSVEGALLYGTATLTHNIPCAPELVEPAEVDLDDEDAADDIDTLDEPVTINWNPVTRLLGEDPEEAGAVGCTDDGVATIVGYQVIVEGEAGEFDITLPATTTQVTVPNEFTDPDTAYKFEVLAIEVSGNQTIVESYFCTADLEGQACVDAAALLD